MTSFEQVVAAQRQRGQATYGSWDAQAFASLVERAAAPLWRSLSGDTAAPQVLDAYLQLGQEALAVGSLSISDTEGFFARLWLQMIPEQVVRVAAQTRIARMVELWNLGEGVRNEGQWLDLAVGQQLDPRSELAAVEASLEQRLETIFTPGASPTWERNPCYVVDVRPVSDRFLPGPMHLLAPRIVCVHDRRDDDACVALWLRPGEGGQLLGRIDGGQPYADPRPVPHIEFDGEDMIGIDERIASTPNRGAVYSHLVVPEGFVVASAVDSQRLWVVGGG